MNQEIDQDLTAYDRNYVPDNNLSLQWYPRSVVDIAQAQTDGMLELGLGHSYSSEYFAMAFQRYRVLEGSQEIIDRFRDRFTTEGIELTRVYFENFETDERFDAGQRLQSLL